MVPVYQGSKSRGYEGTVVAMLQSLEHRKPLLQGYSGFFPPPYERFRDAMRAFPDEASLAYLRSNGVGYIVMAAEWLDDEREENLQNLAPDLEWIHRDATHAVVAFPRLEHNSP